MLPLNGHFYARETIVLGKGGDTVQTTVRCYLCVCGILFISFVLEVWIFFTVSPLRDVQNEIY